MRIIGAASVVFVLALASAVGEVAPARAAAPQQSQRAQADHRKTGNVIKEKDAQRDGQAIFRYDTFGDEQLWTDVLRMHEVIPTVDPATALAVGLKVDSEALPRE